MALRSCSQCGSPAALSLCHLLSTVVVTPRRQKCATSTLYCVACIQRLVGLLETSSHSALEELSKPLNEAYTALTAVPKCDPDGQMESES
jgi:hypothetical protein